YCPNRSSLPGTDSAGRAGIADGVLEVVVDALGAAAQIRVSDLQQLTVLGQLAVVAGAEAGHVLPDRPGASAKRMAAGVVRVEGDRVAVVGGCAEGAVRAGVAVAGRYERLFDIGQVGVEGQRLVLDVVVPPGLRAGEDGRCRLVGAAVRPGVLVGNAIEAKVGTDAPVDLDQRRGRAGE